MNPLNVQPFLSVISSYPFFFKSAQPEESDIITLFHSLQNLPLELLSSPEWTQIKFFFSLVEHYLITPHLSLEKSTHFFKVLYPLYATIDQILVWLNSNQSPPDSVLKELHHQQLEFINLLSSFVSNSQGYAASTASYSIVAYAPMDSLSIHYPLCPTLPIRIEKKEPFLEYPLIQDPHNYLCLFLTPSLRMLIYRTQESILHHPSSTPPTFQLLYTYSIHNNIFYLGNLVRNFNLCHK